VCPVYSTVRRSLMHWERVDFSQVHIECAYKELSIPPTAQGDWALPNHNGLHIWPRHEFMLIALPNPNKTFTATLFAPMEGPNGFSSLTTPARISSWFEQQFPGSAELFPSLVEQFQESPTSNLLSIKCRPWHFADRIVIMGDAAHAVVPFYGQGMNSGFEDALMFDELWEQFGGQVGKVIEQFSLQRQPAADALADLSIQNYREMSSLTATRWFVAKKHLESVLYTLMPETWIPLYTMVSFTRMPFHHALARAKRQDRLLAMIVGGLTAGVAATTAYAVWGSYLRGKLSRL